MEPLLEKVYVYDCLQCGKNHIHQIIIEFTGLEKERAFFAGIQEPQKREEQTAINCKITLKCPNSGLPIQKSIMIQVPDGEKIKTIKEVTGNDNIENYRNENTINIEREYFDWRRQSLNNIRSFAEKLISLNISSIGILITLLTFLSVQEKLHDGVPTMFLFLSCFILYIVSVIFSALIILPVYMNPKNIGEFEKIMEKIVKRQHIFSMLAMFLFIAAIAASVAFLSYVVFLL